MTNRERALEALSYGEADGLPLVHFGFWPETVAKWEAEGHLPSGIADGYDYQKDREDMVASLLGFDFGWNTEVNGQPNLFPAFENDILERFDDGRRIERDRNGALVMVKEGVVSIPTEVGHTLTDRASWDALVEPRLRWSEERVDLAGIERLASRAKEGGPAPCSPDDKPVGLYAGSLFGTIRDMLGVENTAYLTVDDPELFEEIIHRIGSLSLSLVDATLREAEKRGVFFDFAHYWEDICFKNGPLISPTTFRELVAPWYKKVTTRLAEGGVRYITLDCDGLIDSLLPIWVENGVNVMFPIEVGTWQASIEPWRERYGRAVLGLGGMNKTVFALDRDSIDQEVSRLSHLVSLGGYVPCPDHRIAPDAQWDLVRYYCDGARRAFGA